MEHNLPPSQESNHNPVERMLQEIGHEPAELRPETKLLHKQQLLNLAEKLRKDQRATIQAMPATKEAEAKSAKRPSMWEHFRTLFVSAGVGFALTVAAIVVFLNVRHLPGGSSSSVDALGRILVPAAQATDAFQVYADASSQASPAGSTLILQSKVALSSAQVSRALQVDTGHIADVEQVTPHTFRVQLASVASDRVVRVALPAVIQDATTTNAGGGVTREYSWAVQTTDRLSLVSSIPANNAVGVPLDSGIELNFNTQSFSNVTSSFTITPSVNGRFQMNGRRITFVPAQPLAPATLYHVQVSTGLTTDGLRLAEPLDLQFQTVSSDAAQNNSHLSVFDEFQEIFVGEAPTIQISRSPDLLNQPNVTVTGYRLTEAEATQFLQKRLPYSASFGSGDNVQQYTDLAKTEVFKVDVPVTRLGSSQDEALTLPKQSQAGWYLVRIASGNKTTWMFLQVTNLASYVVADKDQLVVWAVNAETRQPLTNLAIRLDDGASVATDGNGIAHLPAPAFLMATTTLSSPAMAVLHLGDATGPLQALTVVGPYNGASVFNRPMPAHDATWGYIFPDRPLYHPTDVMQVAGILQSRDHAPVGQAEIRLTKSSFSYELGGDQNRIYASAPLSLDAAGRYQTQLSWTNISPGYYQLDLLRNGELVISRWVEIRAFTKPAYYVNVTLSAQQLLAGQEAQAHIQASFFSGAPVPKAHFKVRMSQGDVELPEQDVTLNDQGVIDLPLKMLPVACGRLLADGCRNNEEFQLLVYPVAGEETTILGSGLIDVYASELDIRGDAKADGNQAQLSFQTYHRDLSKDSSDTGATWTGRKLAGQYVGVHYEKIQDGVWYDSIAKQVVPYYRYEQRRDPPVQFNVQTDGNGNARYQFAMQLDRDYYEVTVQGEDTQSRTSRFVTTVSSGWYGPGAGSDISLSLKMDHQGDVPEAGVGELLNAKVMLGTSTYDGSTDAGVLFLTLSRGIQQVNHVVSANLQTTFTNNLQPNVTLRAVVFHGKQFFTADETVFQKKADRTLDVMITTDKQAYRPGETMRLSFQAKPQTAGQLPLTDTKIAYTVVDESLLALANSADEDPVSAINNLVSDGTLFQRVSHRDNWLYGPGGAEKGGGGAGDAGSTGNPRRILKDVAGTGFVALDDQGKATVDVVLPDNLTAWRITGVALASDLRAGIAKQTITVDKPVFVDAVIPAQVLPTDQAVLKLRAFGTGLVAGAPVLFTLDAPTLGLNHYQATGTAGLPTYIALPKLVVGSQKIVVALSQGTQTDALERTVEVVPTRISRSEVVTLEPTAGMALPITSPDTLELVVTSRGRTSLYPELRALADTQSLRTDARVAAALAQNLLKTVYGEPAPKNDEDKIEATTLQNPDDGGIRLLPYGSSEVGLSSQVALTAPELVDGWALRNYLAGQLNASSTRLDHLQALAGLAALRAPVVLDLQQTAALTDRSPQETLAIVEGLAAVGDTERAGSLLRQLLQRSVKHDGERLVVVGNESSPETYEATAEAAALAERLLMPQANELQAFTENHWSNEAFPVLAKIRYLTFRLQHLPVEDGRFQWTDGTQTQTINLKDTPWKVIVLSPEQAARFHVVSVSGPVTLSYAHSVNNLPIKDASLSLVRRYVADKPLDQLEEGDELTIAFDPQFASSSLNGCAIIRDQLPANLQAFTTQLTGKEIPLITRENTTSFVVCKGDSLTNLGYRAKVMARGSYRAEPAIMERLDTPSVATYSADQVITVR